MTDEPRDPEEAAYDQAGLPEASSDRDLEQAACDLESRLRSDETAQPTDEWFVREVTFQRLVQWAKDSGFYYEELRPHEKGGTEHDLIHHYNSLSFLKLTKPSAVGYSVSFDIEDGCFELSRERPVEYLRRMALHSQLFGIPMSFVGVAGPDKKRRR